ncbi:MAG: DUF2867 domain-containing protein [Thermodesulfobacteriota bacterium]
MNAAGDATRIRQRLAEVLPEAAGADHVDVKTVQGRCGMRRFLAAMLSWTPGWAAALFKARGVLARVLGLRHEDFPAGSPIAPEAVPMAPGGSLRFFVVRAAQEDDFWIAEAGDKHLDAWIAVLAEPLPDGLRRYHVCTVVRHRHWTGPLYFALILPFHHLIVAAMAKAGVREGDA